MKNIAEIKCSITALGGGDNVIEDLRQAKKIEYIYITTHTYTLYTYNIYNTIHFIVAKEA